MFILSIIPIIVLIIIKSKKSLHMLQQNSYNTSNRYLKWIFKNIDLKKVLLESIIIIFIFLFSNNMIVYFLYYLLILYLYLKEKAEYKKPLVITNRIKRLIFTNIIFYMVLSFLVFYKYEETLLNDYYIILTSLSILNYFVIYIINIINYPLEKYVYFYFKFKSIKKIRSFNNLKIIGITGSYGKTSSKNILSDILNVKYNALPSPKSRNTPYGLMQTINEDLNKFHEVFIAEMGACEKGDIKELCDLVKPKYGVLTKIGLAHLETFKTEETIQKTKFELIESLPKEGIAILNKDDDKQVNYKLKNKVKTIWIGIDNKEADIVAKNIKMSKNGMDFEVIIDKNSYDFTTKILGIPNVYNILAGIALSKELGLTIKEIQKGVGLIKPTEHRMQLKKFNDINIIDDAFNSNPIGSKMALDVLNLMKGKKIIVTPGMIELGEKQYILNKEFGKQIAEVCDLVILVGKNQTKPIYDGLIEKKYDKDKLFVIEDFKECFNIINKYKEKETYVLLENDLPDIFK